MSIIDEVRESLPDADVRREILNLHVIQRNHIERLMALARQAKNSALVHRQQGEMIRQSRILHEHHTQLERLDAEIERLRCDD